ncbi:MULTISPECIES: MerR family transcriptional regulator [unclassified Polaromonas]|uniref:MerR family transcriptional regulator n=1 Tax=unclassified Polaromonas TaxID=2638319 RepID=UPI000F08F85B|nr:MULTISPECIES: MerR family transcriptional regulator [unclassified Polaromonas]AYQ27844.1 MerR family transcriptional regulator [Polaromonas sp. SP1]QGJ17297.1 MerR family transcriptional regulator [Polaromonas sp. Pch-P]
MTQASTASPAVSPTVSLSIAEAAEASGLSAYTLRYYEQIGLIAPIDRRSGARRYSDADMRWLDFLVRLRATGMSMRDMQRYAQLLRKGNAGDSLAERQTMLEDHAARLEADIRTQRETLQYIRKKIALYEAQRAVPKRA